MPARGDNRPFIVRSPDVMSRFGPSGGALHAAASSRPLSQSSQFSETERGSEYENDEQRSYDESDATSLTLQRHRPIVTVDWRSEICRFLRLSTQTSDDGIFDALEEAEDKIRDAERLRHQALAGIGSPRSQVVYVIRCRSSDKKMFYLDMPWVVEAGPYNSHLRGSRNISNLDLFLERNKDISMLVFREFKCCRRRVDWSGLGETGREFELENSPFFNEEFIHVVSEDMKKALQDLSQTALKTIPHPDFGSKEPDNITYPYLWWFHRRKEITGEKDNTNSTLWQYIEVLEAYLKQRLGPEWDAVDKLTATGRITAALLRYIFIPDDIIVSKRKGSSHGSLVGLTVKNWLTIESLSLDKFHAVIDTESWEFDGSFYRVFTSESLDSIPVKSLEEEFSITDLRMHPARFAKEGVIASLRLRGQMLWKCRHSNFISYIKGGDEDAVSWSHSRFMIDVNTYNEMHPKSANSGTFYQSLHNSLSVSNESSSEMNDSIDMGCDEPPLDDSFIMCLPPTIQGFDMRRKKWEMLEVDSIQDVLWNDAAFEDLVIDRRTKQLVEAVVTNKLRSEDNVDLIHGKGSGLIILLHGGPGTGKTLTAESVAEIARKPLYRVTCGDVPTKPDEAEKYLDTVSSLGKIWGCVVLIDEADVFSERRSLANLERNALVSVFLRTLEYFEGILILTTNRVGTFDEAFKSRIQLNLRYRNLDRDQRLTIWTNFVNRLEAKERDRRHVSEERVVDFDQVRRHLPSLAAEVLNGREIRNVISTARQLSLHQKRPLQYEHLKVVIDEAKTFENYLTTLHGGFSADQIQHDEQTR